MPKPFFQRLKDYYLKVGAVLRGEAESASIFPNTTDIGMSRERVYAEFLRQHAPSKCNVFFGGFVFDEFGNESSQLDVIVTTDTTPQFNLHNPQDNGKSFSPIEGTLGIASIKSMLNKAELENALQGIATIPYTSPLQGRVNPLLKIHNYEDWPYKIIYASDGIAIDTLLEHLTDFYTRNPSIPVHRRPDIIHVAGKYVILRSTAIQQTLNEQEEKMPIGQFGVLQRDPDLHGILCVTTSLQKYATISSHITYSYDYILNEISRL